MKVIYLPLDERPCNAAFAARIADGSPLTLMTPPQAVLGNKKTPANAEEIEKFLLAAGRSADACVLSLDMLLYGGIVPSRIHHLSPEMLEERLGTVRRMKEENPELKIFAFALIMRCPAYSSSDEEPDYYETCGREIFLSGQVKHKRELGLVSPGKADALLAEYGKKTKAFLSDFETRRRVNRSMLEKILTEYRDCFEVLVIPQDDSATYGYTTMDREYLKGIIEKSGYGDVPMYPGADEVGMTLLCRAACDLSGRHPRLACVYADDRAKDMTPLYEDRPVGKTLPLLLSTSGCLSPRDGENADITLYLNYPANEPREVWDEPSAAYGERNLPAFCDRIAAQVRDGKTVAVADVAFCNGGEAGFVRMLADRISLTDLSSYAGWNTSSNTVGTAVCQAVFAWLFGASNNLRLFTAERLYEDVGYCGHVRRAVTREIEPMGFGYFDAGETDDVVAHLVRDRLNTYMKEKFPEIADTYEIDRCRMPWRRMFEVDLTLKSRTE